MGCDKANERLKTNVRPVMRGEEVHPVHKAGAGFDTTKAMVARFFPKGRNP